MDSLFKFEYAKCILINQWHFSTLYEKCLLSSIILLAHFQILVVTKLKNVTILIVHSIQVLSAMTEMVMWCYWTGLVELEGPYGGLCLPTFQGHHCAVSSTAYIIDTFNHYCWISHYFDSFLQNNVKIDTVLQKKWEKLKIS